MNTDNPAVLASLRGGLIVSCQAEDDDPFNCPEHLALFARAAEMGGARGLRACGTENIGALRAASSRPIIGLTKSRYQDGSVLITPDIEDVEAILEAGADIIATDATDRRRPNGMRGSEFVAAVLKVQLTRVHELIDRRTENSAYLTEQLADVPGVHPLVLDERITRCSYLGFSMHYKAEELEGVHRDTFLKALKAEGVSIGTGYTALVHEMPLCTGENLRSGDRRRFTGRNIDAAKEGRFPKAEHARSHTSMRMVQNWLLSDRGVVDDVVRAVHKVVENIAALKQ